MIRCHYVKHATSNLSNHAFYFDKLEVSFCSEVVRILLTSATCSLYFSYLLLSQRSLSSLGALHFEASFHAGFFMHPFCFNFLFGLPLTFPTTRLKHRIWHTFVDHHLY